MCLAGCASTQRTETLLEGKTMGSAWTVKVAGALPVPADELRAGVQAQFDAVDRALSTYRPDSALSRFNDVETDIRQVHADLPHLEIFERVDWCHARLDAMRMPHQKAKDYGTKIGDSCRITTRKATDDRRNRHARQRV